MLVQSDSCINKWKEAHYIISGDTFPNRFKKKKKIKFKQIICLHFSPIVQYHYQQLQNDLVYPWKGAEGNFAGVVFGAFLRYKVSGWPWCATLPRSFNMTCYAAVKKLSMTATSSLKFPGRRVEEGEGPGGFRLLCSALVAPKLLNLLRQHERSLRLDCWLLCSGSEKSCVGLQLLSECLHPVFYPHQYINTARHYHI